jgi:hypothetical protein
VTFTEYLRHIVTRYQKAGGAGAADTMIEPFKTYRDLLRIVTEWSASKPEMTLLDYVKQEAPADFIVKVNAIFAEWQRAEAQRASGIAAGGS